MDVIAEEVLSNIYTSILLVYSLWIYTYLMILAFKNLKINHSFFVGMLGIFIVHFIGNGAFIYFSDRYGLPMSLVIFFMTFGIFSLVAVFFMMLFTGIRYVIECA